MPNTGTSAPAAGWGGGHPYILEKYSHRPLSWVLFQRPPPAGCILVLCPLPRSAMKPEVLPQAYSWAQPHSFRRGTESHLSSTNRIQAWSRRPAWLGTAPPRRGICPQEQVNKGASRMRSREPRTETLCTRQFTPFPMNLTTAQHVFPGTHCPYRICVFAYGLLASHP